MRRGAAYHATPGAALVAASVAVLALLAGCAAESEEARSIRGRTEVSAFIDREDLAFGDDLTFTLEARSDPAVEVELPHPTEFPGFRLLDAGTARSEHRGMRVERRWHRLRVERAGTQTLPALTARYRTAVPAGSSPTGSDEGWTALATAPIDIEVSSLLPAAEKPGDIRDIKPLQPIDRARPWVRIAAAIAIVLALATAVAYWIRSRRRRAKALPQAPPVPAHELALAALATLAASEPVGDAAVRRFYFALSEIVRAYVEGRFGLNATDLTTEEILSSLDGLPLDETPAQGLRAFLRESDQVKFAAHRPGRARIPSDLAWARGFVEATLAVEPQPVPAEAATREAA